MHHNVIIDLYDICEYIYIYIYIGIYIGIRTTAGLILYGKSKIENLGAGDNDLSIELRDPDGLTRLDGPWSNTFSSFSSCIVIKI